MAAVPRRIARAGLVAVSALALVAAGLVAVAAAAPSSPNVVAGATRNPAASSATATSGKVATPATLAAAGVGERIENNTSGKCLTVWGTSDGAAITQVPCTNNDTRQLWTLVSTGGDTFQIRNVASQGCLDLFDDISVDGTMVFTWSCQPAGGIWSQNWKIPYVGNNWYEIHPANMSRTVCLDVDSGNVSDGADVKSWGCHSAGNQQWIFV